jgi:hypothetical protein
MPSSMPEHRRLLAIVWWSFEDVAVFPAGLALDVGAFCAAADFELCRQYRDPLSSLSCSRVSFGSLVVWWYARLSGVAEVSSPAV